MSYPHATLQLLRQVAGALPWGLFFSLAPTEVLFLGALGWVPLLVWRERIRSSRHGFFTGAVARLGVVAVIITTAALLPMKHEDGRVGPLARQDVSLGELNAAEVIYPLSDRRHDGVRIVLPSATPTRREVMQAITRQTGFKASINHCGNGATVLFGSGGGRITVDDKHEQPKPPKDGIDRSAAERQIHSLLNPPVEVAEAIAPAFRFSIFLPQDSGINRSSATNLFGRQPG